MLRVKQQAQQEKEQLEQKIQEQQEQIKEDALRMKLLDWLDNLDLNKFTNFLKFCLIYWYLKDEELSDAKEPYFKKFFSYWKEGNFEMLLETLNQMRARFGSVCTPEQALMLQKLH